MTRDLTFKQTHPLYNTPGDAVSPKKDLPFMSSALVDTTYAARIAATLGRTTDVTMWNASYTDLENDMLTWFWSTPTAEPPQGVNVETGQVTPGNVMSVTPVLYVKRVRGDYAQGPLQLFDSLYDPTEPFAGFGNATNDVRYGITSFTIYGLMDNDHLAEATTLSNAMLRDIVSTHMFAERYQWDDTGIFPAGQRPSLFGVATVIDAVWMNNGYRMDLGTPAATSFAPSSGGVSNISLQGKTLNVRVIPAAERVLWSGSAVDPAEDCRTQSIEPGQTKQLTDACATVPLH